MILGYGHFTPGHLTIEQRAKGTKSTFLYLLLNKKRIIQLKRTRKTDVWIKLVEEFIVELLHLNVYQKYLGNTDYLWGCISQQQLTQWRWFQCPLWSVCWDLHSFQSRQMAFFFNFYPHSQIALSEAAITAHERKCSDSNVDKYGTSFICTK